MKYTVRCGEKRHKLDIERSNDFAKPITVEMGKKEYQVKVHDAGPGGELRLVSINNRVISVQVRRRPDGFPYKVILNGSAYPVEIERVESTRYKPSVAPRKINGSVKANLPGQISRVLVGEGDKVRQGQTLVVLEAMKMENEVLSPIDGVIKTINVKPKQLILKNDLLVVVE